MAPAKVEKTLPTVLPENFTSWDGDPEIPAVLPDDFEDFDDVAPAEEKPLADEPVVKEKVSAAPAPEKPVEQKSVERVVKAKSPAPPAKPAPAPAKKNLPKSEDEFDRAPAKKETQRVAKEDASPLLQAKSRQVIAEEDLPKSGAKGKIIIGSVAAVVVLGAAIGIIEHRSSAGTHPQVSIATTSAQPGSGAEDKPSPSTPNGSTTDAGQTAQTAQQQQQQQQQQQMDAAKGRPVNSDLMKNSPSRINAKVGGNQEPAPMGQIAMDDSSYRGNANMFGGNKAKVNLGASGPSRVSVPTGTALGYLQKRVVPDYPAIARSARISGQVSVRIAVNKNGSVEDAHAFSGPMVFYESAEQAVKRWKFNPYKVNNQPVTMDTVVTLVFELK